jgi:hypothetical protein
MTCSARIPSTIGNGSAILFRHLARSVQQRVFERRATEEGVDPVQNRSERRFRTGPHPSFSFPKEERTTSVQHSAETVALFRCAVASQQNVLICGDPVTGKGEAMAATISDTDRIALIEETSEIPLEEPNYVHFLKRGRSCPLWRFAPLPPVTNCGLLRATLWRRTIASSSVKCAARKRSTCCGRSTRSAPVV